jgi:hypothetical protein
MVLLVAISVPMFKPMLDSQKTSGGAQTVAMALQRARVRAMMGDQRPCGVQFERFTEGNEPNVALRMKLLRNVSDYITTVNSYRIKVVSGRIEFYEFNGTNWVPYTATGGVPSDWSSRVKSSSLVQFGRQGRFYQLSGNNRTLAAPYNDLNHPAEPFPPASPCPPEYPPVEFRVKQQPRQMLIPPVIMPRGTVVDLQHSGLGKGRPTDANFGSGNESITIMFSPSGYVDRYSLDGAWPGVIPKDPIHFCVGEWERAISIGHEDGRSNIQMGSNFWVTIYPRTGDVRVTEMNPSTDLETARQFATENFVDIGGF